MVKNALVSELGEKIVSFKEKKEIKTIGRLAKIADGIAYIDILKSAVIGEVLIFPKDIKGLVFDLRKDSIGAIVLGDFSHLREGDEVKATGEILKIPVGEDLIGRVVDPLMKPLDGKGVVHSKANLPIEKIAPGVIHRKPVDTPLQTGIIAIDSMIPIGRGQRELIIGDRETGKTAIAIDTIINQKDVVCIYVAIGQKAAKTAQIAAALEEHGAMEHTIIISANASDSAGLQYIAPYSGCTLAEYFMEKGKDALVVYDDLTKHAWAYRQLSLLFRRPSGREAYPGDIFYLHSRLLERSCQLNDEKGGGSSTALPIIETQAGDISAFIPTNVISITDGQIYLEPNLFYAGIRPAINIGLSVSRVGGEAQIKPMKKVAGKLRLDLAQYREMAAFAQFESELDETTKKQIEKGRKLTEILKQAQFQPLPVEEQIALIWAVLNNFIPDIPLEKIGEWKERFLQFIKITHSHLLKKILKDGVEKTAPELEKAVIEFNKEF